MKLDAHTTDTPLGSMVAGVTKLANMDIEELTTEQAEVVEDILRDLDEQVWYLIETIQLMKG